MTEKEYNAIINKLTTFELLYSSLTRHGNNVDFNYARYNAALNINNKMKEYLKKMINNEPITIDDEDDQTCMRCNRPTCYQCPIACKNN